MLDWTPHAVSVACLALSGVFDNHLWRILLLVARHNIVVSVGYDFSILDAFLYLVVATAGIWWMPHYANRTPLPKTGCIFVTGCDSGMGKATVVELAKANAKANANDGSGDGSGGYDQIFAGCFNIKTALVSYEAELSEDEMKVVTLVSLDVTDHESVNDAAHLVRDWIYQRNKTTPSRPGSPSRKKGTSPENHHPAVATSASTTPATTKPTVGLTGLVQFHGVAFNGPSAYMPVGMYTRQLDVNFVGTIRVVQAFLPLLKEAARSAGGGGGGASENGPPSISPRIVLTGTGGGPCSPCPPLLTAYMSSKFALEAYAQSLRQELFMTNERIRVAVINPGFVKPTMLIEEGTRISAGMWEGCSKKLGSNVAQDEYGGMLDHFTQYSALQPGTHVSEIVKAAEAALLSPVPRSSYKVGIDSKLAPLVGMLPTGARETIARHGIYGVLSLAGTVPGYKV